MFLNKYKIKNLLKKIGHAHKNKIVFYTAIFGGYDDLKEPDFDIPGCDFICFTDNKNLRPEKFKIVSCKRKFSDSTRDAKIYKIFPHKFLAEYEYSIWIDGSIKVKTPDVKELILNALERKNIAVFRHPERDCVYDELDACIRLKKDDTRIMEKQVNKYKKEGYPEHNGLGACTIIARKHNDPTLIKIEEQWWDEISENSRRDQLSFDYVMWKNNYKYGYLEGNLWENEFFIREKHKNS